jgi:hypothetical protein
VAPPTASSAGCYPNTLADMGFYPVGAVAGGSGIPWIPSDNNLLLANGDPWDAQASVIMAAGTQYLAKLTARTTTLISNLWFGLQVAGTGTSTGSFAGLISPAGAVLTSSADIDSQLTGATGAIEVPLTTPQTVLAGSFVWAAIVQNLSVTQATLAKGTGGAGGGGIVDVGLTAANYRFATNGTILSAITAITPSANQPTTLDWWVGAS